MEQMNLFDYFEDRQGYHYCRDCESAKFKEKTLRGTTLWFCGKHHMFITEHTIDKYATADKCFKRRTG